MPLKFNGKPRLTKKMVEKACREEIVEIRYHSASDEFDVYVQSSQENLLYRHASVKVKDVTKRDLIKELLQSKEKSANIQSALDQLILE